MKTKSSIVLIAILGLFIFSCNNTTNEGNSNEETTQNQESTNETSEIEETENNEETNVDTKKAFHEEILINPDQIKNGDIINDLTVANAFYKPHDSFGFDLEGEFVLGGSLMIDEMWSEPALQIDNEQNPHSNIFIDLGGDKKQVFNYCYFSNHKTLLEALSEENRNKIQNGQPIQIKLKVKNFSMGGKLDGYGDSSIEFVEIVK